MELSCTKLVPGAFLSYQGPGVMAEGGLTRKCIPLNAQNYIAPR
jgi:hypothetical protein